MFFNNNRIRTVRCSLESIANSLKDISYHLYDILKILKAIRQEEGEHDGDRPAAES